MTKASPELKPMQGVHRPEGSVNWHYQKKFPKDLQGHPEAPRNGWAHRGTLGTSDLREANGKAAQLLAGLEKQWGLMRQALTITPPEAVTPELRAAIAHQLKAPMLAADEALRDDPAALAQSLAGWWETQERGRKVAHEAAEESPYEPRQMPRVLTDSGRQDVQMLVRGGRAEVALFELLPMLHERHEAAHKEARSRLVRGQSGPFLLLADAAGQPAKVQTRTVDVYGRTVGVVSCQGRDASRLMVQHGMAWAYRQYLKRPELVPLEEAAKGSHAGLWAQAAVAPWEYRKQVKVAAASAAASAASAAPEGSAQVVHTGPRGGRYVINSAGHKEYLPKNR